MATGRQLSAKFAPGFGKGPVFAVGGDRAVFILSPDSVRDGWYPIKILWVAEPAFTGNVLVRASATPGDRHTKFMGSPGAADDELRIDWAGPGSVGWREWASYTWVSAPGCYQWQVDSEVGSDVIVFKADLTAS